MKKAAHYWSSFYHFLFSLFSSLAYRNSIITAKNVLKRSSNIETKQSKISAIKRPSLYFILSCTSMLLAAIIQFSTKEVSSPEREKLLKLGWQVAEELKCPWEKNSYYFIENEIEGTEAFIDEYGTLISHSAPEAPYTCTKIPSANNIEEI